MFGKCLRGQNFGYIKKKGVSKSKSKSKEIESEEETPDWLGNNDYFQTGKKAGQLKPKAK